MWACLCSVEAFVLANLFAFLVRVCIHVGEILHTDAHGHCLPCAALQLWGLVSPVFQRLGAFSVSDVSSGLCGGGTDRLCTLQSAVVFRAVLQAHCLRWPVRPKRQRLQQVCACVCRRVIRAPRALPGTPALPALSARNTNLEGPAYVGEEKMSSQLQV